mgnify:CR=1 FL=1
MLLELPGPIPLTFLTKPLIEIDRKCSWKLLKNPSSSIIESSLRSMEHARGSPWANSLLKSMENTPGALGACFLHFFIKSVLEQMTKSANVS